MANRNNTCHIAFALGVSKQEAQFKHNRLWSVTFGGQGDIMIQRRVREATSTAKHNASIVGDNWENEEAELSIIVPVPKLRKLRARIAIESIAIGLMYRKRKK